MGLTLLLCGCGIRAGLTIWATQPVIEGAMASLLSETDPDLAREGLESQLKLLEGLLNVRPDDLRLLELAVRGFTGYAMMFLEPEDTLRARMMYRRAVDYGMRALSRRDARFARDDLTWAEFEPGIRHLKSRDIAIVYWTANALAGLVNLGRTSPQALADAPRAVALMQWVYEKDCHYYFSGPLWFFGTYYATLPPLAGGNLELARSYFTRAIEAHGDRFLWGKLLFAQYYAVQALDRALFTELLGEIATGATDEPPELRLINRVAARRAIELLSKTDEIF